MSYIQVTINLEPQTCCACGCIFGVEQSTLEGLKKNGKAFYCPNGHGQSFTDTEVDKLNKRIEWEREAKKNALEQLESERRSHIATKGQLTKLKNKFHQSSWQM